MVDIFALQWAINEQSQQPVALLKKMKVIFKYKVR